MIWSLYNLSIVGQVAALLDASDADNKGRADFTPGLPRDQVENAIHALLWAYSSRPSDTAFGYAMMNFWQAMKVDLFASQIAWLDDGTKSECENQPQKGENYEGDRD